MAKRSATSGWLPVEGRVEASYLRNLRVAGADLADRRQIVGLVQRRQRHELLQPVEHGLVDQGRGAVVGAAMDDAVADRHRRHPAQLSDQPVVELAERGRNVADLAWLEARRRSGWCRRHPWRPGAAGCRCPPSGRGTRARAGRPSAISNSWNLMLDEPALTTSRVSATAVTPPPARRRPGGCGRRGRRPRMRRSWCGPRRPGWSG